MSDIKLYHGDCLEMMKQIPDESVDMILCDPPYGTTSCTWDILIPFDMFWSQMKRIRKDRTPIVIFGQEPFSSFLRTSNLSEYRYDWIWEKERLTNVFQVKRRPGKTIENISVFYKTQCTYKPQKSIYEGPARTNRIGKDARFSITQSNKNHIKPLEYHDNGTRYPMQIIRIKREKINDGQYHPTQKPVALLSYLIRTYSNEGDVVLDNCMGSGSTGVACIETGRNFIGIESDDHYFQVAKDRIEKRKAQGVQVGLFS